jgi:hypothetical protein
MYVFYRFVLSCIGRGLVTGSSPVKEDLPEGFIVSEVNSDLEQTRGPNPRHLKKNRGKLEFTSCPSLNVYVIYYTAVACDSQT